MRIEIDGNDGVGKSTLIAELRKIYSHEILDRGSLTKATDSDIFIPSPGTLYILLDASVETCRTRLSLRGADLDEKYHTVSDLTFYRKRFLDLANRYSEVEVVTVEESSITANLELLIDIIEKHKNND